MLSETIKTGFSRMNFVQLHNLIDYCLQKEEHIPKKHLSFVTYNCEKISEYIDILETKIPPKPIYSPPKAMDDYKKESEIRISAKREEYEQKNASKNKLIKESVILINELEIQLAKYQNEVSKISSESPVYNRLMYWKLKMQDRNQNLDKLDITKIEAEIEKIKKRIRLAQELQWKLEDSKLEKKLFDVFIETESRWLSMKELENPEKHTQKEYEIKVNQYNAQKKNLLKIIEKMRSDLINFIPRKVSAQTLNSTQVLNWKLLPTGAIPFHYLKNYLQEVSKSSREEFDLEKIEKIISLDADKIYCGIDDFNGYLVFLFEEIELAVLDCPQKGNAIYIFGEDWKTLSRLSKSELLNYYPNKTKRIIHRGDWFERLKLILQTHQKNS